MHLLARAQMQQGPTAEALSRMWSQERPAGPVTESRTHCFKLPQDHAALDEVLTEVLTGGAMLRSQKEHFLTDGTLVVVLFTMRPRKKTKADT